MRILKMVVAAVLVTAAAAGCKTVKTGPDPVQSTFSNPAPSLMPTNDPTPTVGEVR